MTEFEAAYRQKIVPLLNAHGLTESSERGRATPDSVFSRLFEVKTPAEVEERGKSVQGDPSWKEMLRNLSPAFVATKEDSLRYSLKVYSTPAAPGKVIPAGPGRKLGAVRGQGRWRTYDVAAGLPSTIIYTIFQDREGNLWFGTSAGVCRYDSRQFTTLTTQDGLVHNQVTAITQDREGNLWFGTGGVNGEGGGVSRYDGKAFTNYSVKEGLAHQTVPAILQDRKGILWFGTLGGGVSRYDPSAEPALSGAEGLRTGGKTFTTLTTRDGLPSDFVSCIFEDRAGHLWFGTRDGLSRYNGKTFTTYTSKDGLARSGVRTIIQDREGTLWFVSSGGFGGRVSRYDGRVFSAFTAGDSLKGTNSISMDLDGHLWFSRFYLGVSRYDGKSIRTFTTRDGLVSDRIQVVFHDREGHLWIGMYGEGLCRYDGETITSFTTQDSLSLDMGNTVFQDREGHYWFGSDRNGLSRFNGETWTTFGVKDGLPSVRAGAIAQDRDGVFWFGAWGGGICRYDGKTFSFFGAKEGFVDPLNRLLSVFQDREGVLWFGTYRGVTRYDGKTLTNFGPEDGLLGVVGSILQDREGSLWFGTLGGGVAQYDGRAFKTFTAKDGLPTNEAPSVLEDREGRLWFGTGGLRPGGGVVRYDGRTFTSFSQEETMVNKSVGAMMQDRQGNLWFAVDGSGLLRYDGQVFQTLLQQDGLSSNLSNGIQILLQDREGRIWVNMLRGATCFRQPPPWPPPIFIDAVVGDQRYERPSAVAIPSSVRFSAFEFHAISFKTRPEAMVYRYRLKGYDSDWKNTHARRVEYKDLPRGKYTFEVLAVDRDLVYSEKPATVTLRVRMPFERMGWMSALGVALALVGWQTGRVVRRDRRLGESNTALSSANKELFSVNRQLMSANEQVQEATRQKSRFLASMSHELRTPMNAIMGFTNLVLRRSGEALPQRQRENLEKVKQASDHLLSLINDILDLSKVEAGRLDIKPVRFDVKGLIASCCATVSPLVKPGIDLTYEVSDDVGEAHTDEARLRQIIVNLLSNALKFTEQGEVRVKCQVSSATQNQTCGTWHVERGTWAEDGMLVLSVSDTGVGIPPEALGLIFEEFRQVEGSHQTQKGTGLGLSITRRLTELLGGTIGVESQVGKGSVFTVRLPAVYAAEKA